MGVPRGDLLLMTRVLKRGFGDVKSIRRALERQMSRPISLLEALHLPSAEADSLRADASEPDPAKDRPILEELREMLLAGEHLTPGEWEKYAASFARSTVHREFASLPVPSEFDGYALQWELARRERGVVYRARDREGRDLAIKIFRLDVPVAAAAPKITGHAYAVSPFEDGESLERQKLPLRRTVEALEKAARALGTRTHGALTPAHLLVRRDDSVAVIGFEAARIAPPSARARMYSDGDDLRALGAMLYEAIVGSPPAGETAPSARTKQVDEPLDRIVSCALTGGYVSAAALADDLARWLHGEAVATRKAPVPAAPAKSRRWGWAVAATVPLAVLVVWLAMRGGKPAVREPEVAREAPRPVPASKPPSPPAPPIPRVSAKPLTHDDEMRLQDECAQALGEGNFDRLIALANEAVARGCAKEWPHLHLAAAWLARGELDKPVKYGTRALELAPGSRDALEIRAQAYALRGEAGKALADFDTLYGRRTADLNREIRRLDARISVDPRDAGSLLLRGALYHVKRHHETAARDFTAAADLGQRRALAWRAFADLGRGDRAAAAADAKAYLSEFPSDFATEEVKSLLKDLGAN